MEVKESQDICLRSLHLTFWPHYSQVDKNKDLFFKDVSDGVNVLLCGQFGHAESPLVFVGGNCSIQGYDSRGAEKFWTVTGDNVAAMTFCDVDGDGRNELLVGSDDFDIRVFQDESMVAEVSEADQILALAPVHLSRFGYALVNGTIGLYDRLDRAWRVKSKHTVRAKASSVHPTPPGFSSNNNPNFSPFAGVRTRKLRFGWRWHS